MLSTFSGSNTATFTRRGSASSSVTTGLTVSNLTESNRAGGISTGWSLRPPSPLSICSSHSNAIFNARSSICLNDKRTTAPSGTMELSVYSGLSRKIRFNLIPNSRDREYNVSFGRIRW